MLPSDTDLIVVEATFHTLAIRLDMLTLALQVSAGEISSNPHNASGIKKQKLLQKAKPAAGRLNNPKAKRPVQA